MGRILKLACKGFEFKKTLNDHGSPFLNVDAEILKCGEQKGLEAPVVHTLNYEINLL